MGHATSKDGVKLYFEETGSGLPLLFIHEFGGEYRSWEPQVRFFSRRYRCITYNARGYPPSDVPTDTAMYSQAHAAADAVAVLDHLGIDKAHVVGLSMGGFCTVHVGLSYPERARSLVVAGCGYGAEKQHRKQFQEQAEQVAKQFETQGSKAFAEVYSVSSGRVQFQNKDPRGWREFVDMLGQHDAVGAANTMRGVQANRPSLYDLEDGLRAMQVPTLVISGDEDDHCLQPGIYMKQTIPACGLFVVPKTGHTINLEEPALFNQAVAEFLAMVEAGQWGPRDPRATPAQFMKSS